MIVKLLGSWDHLGWFAANNCSSVITLKPDTNTNILEIIAVHTENHKLVVNNLGQF